MKGRTAKGSASRVLPPAALCPGCPLLDHDGVFEEDVGQGFPRAGLGQLLDVKRVHAAAKDDTSCADLDGEVLNPPSRAVNDALHDDFSQARRGRAHRELIPLCKNRPRRMQTCPFPSHSDFYFVHSWMRKGREQTVDHTLCDTGLISLAGSRPLLPDEVRARVAAGARLVRFEFCFSLLVFTVRRQSPVYLTESWQERYLRGLGYSALALLLGPWAVPWGPIGTAWAVWVNLTGGVDETEAVLAGLADPVPPLAALGTPLPTGGNARAL